MFGIMGKVAIGLGVALLIVSGAFYFYFNWSQEEMGQLREDVATERANVARLKGAIEVQKATITLLEESRKSDQQAVLQLSAENQSYQEEVDRIRKKFARHDIDRLSLAKPGLMEKIINKGTAKVLKEFEDITDPRVEQNFPEASQ